MKKSLKIIYSVLGIFCLINCSECNNFVTPDRFGGNGEVDYNAYVQNFPKNSKDFENFIKYYGKPCIVQQFFPQSSSNVFKPFETSVLSEDKQYEAYLLTADDTSKFSDDDVQARDNLRNNIEIIKRFKDLKKKIKSAQGDKEKEDLKKEAEKLVREHQFLLENQGNLYKFVGVIEEPIVLQGVTVKNFTSKTTITSGGDKTLSANTVWNIEVEKDGSQSPFIKLHEYYLEHLDEVNLGQNTIREDKDKCLIIKFDKVSSTELHFTYTINFSNESIFERLNFGIIPKDFVKCSGKCKILVDLERAPDFHLTFRWPYLRKDNSKKIYQFVRADNNFVDSDLNCICGLSKDDFLTSDVSFHYLAEEDIQYLEGAMFIYNGPYLFKPCSITIGENSTSNIPVYNRTNLPEQNFCPKGNFYDTFDQEFFIEGIKSRKLCVSFPDLKLIPDIEDRFFSGLNGKEGIVFGKDSNKFLRIYAKRVLEEIFHVGEEACPCTKIAALNQFVHYWMTYQDHELTHCMDPIDIFTLRKGICVDYVHLLIGLGSSIGLNNFAKVSGVGCNNFHGGEKHAWCVFYCPHCKRTFEFDPTWNFCFQTGPEHVYISKTHRINDTIDKVIDGKKVTRDLRIKLGSAKRHIAIKE